MSKKWQDSIRATGQLTVFNGGVGGGAWAGVFQKAFDEFNNLVKKHSLPVKMIAATSEKDAQVVVKVSSGTVNYSYDRTDYELKFNPTAMHGMTRLLSRTNDPHVERAYCFLPDNPQIFVPPGKKRPVGINILIFIAVHELVHACGLTDSDHADNGVFHGNPGTIPGDRPAQDKLKVDKKVGPRKLKTTEMPPLFLDTRTIAALKDLWKKPKK